jgi:glycine/D-amino acid oxidase-like deaminating enzyme/nitrite reductase/ring-hydroxylating ferredoxin subunit
MDITIDPNLTSGYHHSYWTDSASPFKTDPLRENKETHVVIIGGGIAGVTIAYSLSLRGIPVVLLEDGFIGSGESGRTTAQLVTALDNRYYDLRRIYGEDKIKVIAESHARAIDFVEDTVRKENIECGFTRCDGFLFLDPSDTVNSLDEEQDAATIAGVNVSLVDVMPGIADSSPALCFHNQAIFHPLKYLAGLCAVIQKNGGEIFTETHAKSIEPGKVTTENGHIIRAAHVVVATNSPVNDMFKIHLKQYPYRTYVIAATIRKNYLPTAMWWDTGDHNVNPRIPPYHYVRTQPYTSQEDLLICGGEDHSTGLEPKDHLPPEFRYDKLEAWTRARFPIGEIRYRWSGQVLEPMDGLAFIGRYGDTKDHVYIVTGDSGNGMTHGTIAGLLIPDLIQDIRHPWEKIYDPGRFKFLKAGGTFFHEVAGMIIDYYRNKPGHSDTRLSSIRPGEGEIVEVDGKMYGAYVDDANKLHLVDVSCTHLGCKVKWNGDEKSWDCPCHGSRFTYDGKVINGPANEPLMHHKEGAHQKRSASVTESEHKQNKR